MHLSLTASPHNYVSSAKLSLYLQCKVCSVICGPNNSSKFYVCKYGGTTATKRLFQAVFYVKLAQAVYGKQTQSNDVKSPFDFSDTVSHWH